MWIVRFGKSENRYFTEYHAEQAARALRLNGTPVEVIEDKRGENPLSVSCKCGLTYSLHMHTVCPSCHRWPPK